MTDDEVLQAGVDATDDDMLIMEAITLRLEAIRMHTRAKIMRRASDLPSHAADALDAAGEVLTWLAARMESIMASSKDPMGELRDRLAFLRRRKMGLVNASDSVCPDCGESCGEAVPRLHCLAYPSQTAGAVPGCNCEACERLARAGD